MVMPRPGDILYLTLNPQAGHEQSGRRPVLVVSHEAFTIRTGMVMVCPITNTNRNLPTQVPLANRCRTTGVVMCEQVKALDIRARNPEYKDHVPDDLLFEAVDIVKGFLWEP